MNEYSSSSRVTTELEGSQSTNSPKNARQEKSLQLWRAFISFYVSNSFSLFHSWDRPKWFGYLQLILEYLSYFALMLNSELIAAIAFDTSSNGIHLKYVALDSLSSEAMHILTAILLAVNCFMIIAFVCLFASYIFGKFANRTLVPLSVLVRIYLPLLMAPQLYFIFKARTVVDFINLPCALLIGYLSACAQTGFDYRGKDSLAKVENWVDQRKYLVKLIFIGGCSFIQNEHTSYFGFGICLYKFIDQLYQTSYINQDIGCFEMQLALSSTSISLMILVASEFQGSIEFLFIWSLIASTLSFKAGSLIYKRSEQDIQFTMYSNIDWEKSLNVKTIDIFTRSVWNRYISERHSVTNSDSSIESEIHIKLHSNTCKLTTCYCRNQRLIANSVYVKQQLMDMEGKKSFCIDYIEEVFRRLFTSSNSLAHRRFTESHLSYLFFLHDCSENEPLFSLKLLEIVQRFGRSASMHSRCVLSYLTSLANKCNTSHNLFKVIEFDHKLEELSQLIRISLKQKEHFLEAISDAFLDLDLIEYIGKDLLHMRSSLANKIRALTQINSNNPQFEFLVSSYQYNIAFEHYLFFKQQPAYYTKHKHVKDIFVKNSAVMFVSIQGEDFGMIKHVSNSISRVFEYEKLDLLNKNISILMPRYIADIHDLVIRKFIRRGFFLPKQFDEKQPFFILTKLGFLSEVRLYLQLSMVDSKTIGISALMQATSEKDDDSIVVSNVLQNFQIVGSTRRLFEDVFSLSIENPVNLKTISLKQIIPIIPLLVSKNDAEEEAAAVAAQSVRNGESEIVFMNDENASIKPFQNKKKNPIANLNRNANIDLTSSHEDNLNRGLLERARVFELESIETIVFLRKSHFKQQNYSQQQQQQQHKEKSPNEQNKLGQQKGISGGSDESKWFLEDIQRGGLCIAHNFVFQVSLRMRVVSDEHMRVCAVTFSQIKLIEDFEQQLDSIRSILLPQFRDLSPELFDDVSDSQLMHHFELAPVPLPLLATPAIVHVQNAFNKSFAANSNYNNSKLRVINALKQASGGAASPKSPSRLVTPGRKPDWSRKQLEDTQEGYAAIASMNQISSGRQQVKNNNNQYVNAENYSYEPSKKYSYDVPNSPEAKQKLMIEVLEQIDSPKFSEQPLFSSNQIDRHAVISPRFDQFLGLVSSNQLEKTQAHDPQDVSSMILHQNSQHFHNPHHPLLNIDHSIIGKEQRNHANISGVHQQNETHNNNFGNISVQGTANFGGNLVGVIHNNNNNNNINNNNIIGGELLISLKQPMRFSELQDHSEVLHMEDHTSTVIGAGHSRILDHKNTSQIIITSGDLKDSQNYHYSNTNNKFIHSRHPSIRPIVAGATAAAAAEGMNGIPQIELINKPEEMVRSNQNSSQARAAKIESERTVEQLRRVHAESVSSQKSSSFITQKKIILSALSNSNQMQVFNILLFLAILSLTSVSIVIVYTYFELDLEFEIQKKNFYYVSWSLTQRMYMSRVNKNFVLHPLMSFSQFNLGKNVAQLQASLVSNSLTNYAAYQAKMMEVEREYISELYIVPALTTTKQKVNIHLTDSVFVTYTTELLSALMQMSYTMLEMTKNTDQTIAPLTSRIHSQSLLTNFVLLIPNLNAVQKNQESNITEVYDRILRIVVVLLIVVCTISALFVISTFPIYSLKQTRKQKVLQLFATIDPPRIREMHKILLISLISLEIEGANASNHRDGFMQSSYAKGNGKGVIAMRKSARRMLQSSSTSTRGENKGITVKDNRLFLKKKQISSTSQLSKYSMLLFSKGAIVYALLIVYPIVNYITTISLISQSSNNQTLLGIMQTVRAQVSSSIGTLGMMINADYNPTGNQAFYTGLYNRYKSIISINDGILSDFQTQITNEKQRSRFFSSAYDSLFFEAITGDTCAVIEANPSFVSSLDLTLDDCRNKYSAIFEHGVLTTVISLQAVLLQPHEIFVLPNRNDRLELIDLFLEQHDFLETNDVFNSLIAVIDALGSFLIARNDEFFDLMSLVQTALMVFQFAMLFLLFRFGLVTFSLATSKDLIQTRQILTILQIPFLVENSYIMNYLSSTSSSSTS